MLSKEECLQALEHLKEYVNADNVDDMVVFSRLIKEHFELVEENKLLDKLNDEQACAIRESFFKKMPCTPMALYEPQPYKFEDLKEEMWVWDNVECECIRVLKTYITNNYHEYYTSGVRVIRTGYEYNWQEIGFRENRFFPVQMANNESKNIL